MRAEYYGVYVKQVTYVLAVYLGNKGEEKIDLYFMRTHPNDLRGLRSIEGKPGFVPVDFTDGNVNDSERMFMGACPWNADSDKLKCSYPVTEVVETQSRFGSRFAYFKKNLRPADQIPIDHVNPRYEPAHYGRSTRLFLGPHPWAD